MHNRQDELPEKQHYDLIYLDKLAEKTAFSFLSEKYGEVKYPISTDDLTLLIEKNVDDFDLYADLKTEHGDDSIEGVTQFSPKKIPSVRISKELSENPLMKNRLRTTLAHELGHVIIHDPLWQKKFAQLKLDLGSSEKREQICKRTANYDNYNWMEWQANYFSSGLLMPISMVMKLYEDYVVNNKIFSSMIPDDENGVKLILSISRQFRVSKEAAKIRLLILKCLCNPDNISSQLSFF